MNVGKNFGNALQFEFGVFGNNSLIYLLLKKRGKWIYKAEYTISKIGEEFSKILIFDVALEVDRGYN